MGTESHTPSVLRNTGSRMIHPARKAKVLRKDIMAEVFPSERAVNKDEAKMLIPANIKLMEKRRNPCDASI